MLFLKSQYKEELYAVVYIENTVLEALKVANILREKGKRVELISKGSNLKKKLEIADKLHASYTLIIGPEELKKGIYILKNMSTKEQQKIGDLESLFNA